MDAKTMIRALKIASDWPIAQSLQSQNSCIIVEAYLDWEIKASLRVWNTTYEFWAKEIEWWWEIAPVISPMIDPTWRKLDIHCIPFSSITISA